VPYSQVKLISFDLDNTLYDNAPVIQLAEQKSREYLTTEFKKQNQSFDYQTFIDYRDQLVLSEKNLPADQSSKYENLSYLRQKALLQCCENIDNGLDIASQAFELFIHYRNRVTIEAKISKLVKRISKQYTIVSVTNGNCDANQLSIGNLFEKHYSPSGGYRAKPHPQMLNQIFADFNLEPNQVLHIGDRDDSDGLAAQKAGCYYYHFEPFVEKKLNTNQCERLIQELR